MKMIDRLIDKICEKVCEKLSPIIADQTDRCCDKMNCISLASSLREKYFVTTLKIAVDSRVIYRRWLSSGYEYPYTQTLKDATEKFGARITIINVVEISREDYESIYSQITEDEKGKDKCSQ